MTIEMRTGSPGTVRKVAAVTSAPVSSATPTIKIAAAPRAANVNAPRFPSVRLARMTKGKAEITGYDYSQPMLDLAGEKAVKAGYKNIRFKNKADLLGIP